MKQATNQTRCVSPVTQDGFEYIAEMNQEEKGELLRLWRIRETMSLSEFLVALPTLL